MLEAESQRTSSNQSFEDGQKDSWTRQIRFADVESSSLHVQQKIAIDVHIRQQEND